MNIPEIGEGLTILFMGAVALGGAGMSGFFTTINPFGFDSKLAITAYKVAYGGIAGTCLIGACAAGVAGVTIISHGFSSADAPVSHPTQSPSGYSVLKK